MLTVFLSLTTAWTMAFILCEILVKILKGQNHINILPFYIYMGANAEALNDKLWFYFAVSCSLLPYAISLLIYKIIKDRYLFISVKTVMKPFVQEVQ